jgi:hypothetical protein
MQGTARTPLDATQSAPAQPSGGDQEGSASSSVLVIGVTGHRNLAEADLERARQSVTSFFDSIGSLLPDTKLRVLLGMAAGGDLVVAEVALERGIDVDAVLPLPLAQFVADFDDRNRARLTTLLSHPRLHCNELRAPECGSDAAIGDAARRNAAYRELTEVLRRRSNLLLALWDGKGSMRPGSTADTVLHYLDIRCEQNREGQRLDFTPGDPAAQTDSPFVYWLPLAPGGLDAGVVDLSPGYVTGLGDTLLKFGDVPPMALRRRLEDLNAYNRDYVVLAGTAGTPPADSLLRGVPTDLLEDDRDWLERIDAQYGRADRLALQFQKRSDGLFGMFGAFAFILGCLYLIYDKLGENQVFLLAYLAILMGSLALYRLLYTKVWFVKHLRYRALAETLRIKFHLCLAGVARSVDAAEVLALSGIEHFEGFGWLGFVLKNVDPVDAGPPPRLDPRRSEHVRKAWVDDQYRYFGRKVRQLELKSRRVARGQALVILFTVLVLLTRVLFARSLRSIYVIPEVPLKNVLMLCAGIMALFLGAWKLHQSKMATRELIWQYKNQLAHFSRSSAELERTTTAARRAELLGELGRRSLMESYLWTIHRYHREHSPPAGA